MTDSLEKDANFLTTFTGYFVWSKSLSMTNQGLFPLKKFLTGKQLKSVIHAFIIYTKSSATIIIKI